MSVRLDNVADYYSRTSDMLDYNAAYAWMTWINFAAGAGTVFMSVLIMDNGGSFQHSDELSAGDVAEGSMFMVFANNNFSFDVAKGTTLPNNDTWYHVAMVRRSLTALDLYVNGTLEATTTADMTTRGVATEMLVGAGYGGGFNNVNGRYAGMKAWSTSLTAAEVRSEMNSLTPKRIANLYSYWPIFPGATERLRGYGVTARNWTANGTLTDEAGPPVNWGIWTPPQPFKKIAVAAAGHSLILDDNLSNRIFGGFVVR
jgi:hypothetical protein